MRVGLRRRSHPGFRVSIGVCVCVLFCACQRLPAAEVAAVTPKSLSPSRQPLLVLRLADPGALLDLLAGSAAKPFAPAELDFAGLLPGLGAEVASAVDFLKALAAAGARDVWYCLLPGGGLSRPVAGMGWQLPAGKETTPEGLAAWLEGAGLPVGARALSGDNGRSPAVGGQRVAVGPDDGTLRELTAGSGPERWRRELAAFMAANKENAEGEAPPALGVWANPRPLLGIASVLGGFDARRAFARLGLAIPESVELAFRPAADGGDVVLSLRLARVLSGGPDAPAPGLELFRPAPAETLLQLHLPSSVALGLLPRPALWEYLPLLNLEPDAFVIQAASLAVWRGRDGSVNWLAGAHFPDAAGFGRNWAKALAAAGDLPGVAAVENGALRLHLNGREVWARPARVEGSGGAVPGAVLVAGAREADLPDVVRPIEIAAGRREVAVRWSARLDDGAGEELAEAAARLIAKMGLGRKAPAADVQNIIPAREAGTVTLDEDSLVVTSDAAAGFLVTLAGLLLR